MIWAAFSGREHEPTESSAQYILWADRRGKPEPNSAHLLLPFPLPQAKAANKSNPPPPPADVLHRHHLPGRRLRPPPPLPRIRRRRRRRWSSDGRRPLQGPGSLLQGTRRLLHVRGEARRQEAHRDRHHGAPLPCRLQEVPRQLRQQLPPLLGEALRPAVLRQEAGAAAARRRRRPPGPHLAPPALHVQAIGKV